MSREEQNVQRVKEKIAIVTGAASGIGAACAARLAQEGALLVVADLNLEGAQEQVRRIKESGGQAVAARVDIGLRHVLLCRFGCQILA